MRPVPVVVGLVLAQDPVGAENPVTLCDLGILADQAAEPVAAVDLTVIAYAEEGARVAVTYANDAAAAERTLARLRDSGCEPLAFPLDLSEPESIEACLIEVTAAFGGLATSSSPTPSAGLSTRESHLPTPTVQPGRAPSARTSRARRPRCGSRFRTSRDRAQAASS
jgi:hypothetical protein